MWLSTLVNPSYLIPRHHFPVKIFAEVQLHVLKKQPICSSPVLTTVTLSPWVVMPGSSLTEIY